MTAMHSFRTWPLLLALALSACGGPMKKPADDYWLAADARNASAVESLVAYQAYVWTLSADDLAKESARVRDAAARDPGDFQRLRSAIAAAAPAAPPRERARAAQMLEQMEKESRDAHQASLLAALRSELAERRRLEERWRDEARRADDLEKKLDALKSIEKSIIDRNQPAGQKR